MQRDWAVKWIVVGVLVLIAIATLGIFWTLRTSTQVQIGGEIVSARIANTTDSRIKGLSGTASLSEDEAMLFVFDTSDKWAIWMKDMNYSIDIVWLDDQKKVIDIAKQVSPDTYPQTFAPKTPAKYVLELSAGFTDRHPVTIGTVTSFQGYGW